MSYSLASLVVYFYASQQASISRVSQFVGLPGLRGLRLVFLLHDCRPWVPRALPVPSPPLLGLRDLINVPVNTVFNWLVLKV